MSYGPPTRTVAEVMRAVKRQFGDESGVQLEDADIVSWVNDAQTVITNKNKILKSTSTAPSVAGQATYTFPAANIHQIEAIHFDGNRIHNVTFAQAEQDYISKDAVPSGTPELWYEWGGSFTFWPAPDTVADIVLYYTVIPATVTSISVLSIPDKYYSEVVSYVLQQAYEMDEDWTASQVKQKQFDESLAEHAEEERTAQHMTFSIINLVD